MSGPADKFGEDRDLILKGTDFVKGMEIAEYEEHEGDTTVYAMISDGVVNPTLLSDVWSEGNFTLGRTKTGSLRVVLDDVHGVRDARNVEGI